MPSYTPPADVAQNARMALQVRQTKPPSERGMTDVGIARATQLANRSPVSLETIYRMVAYFERHEVDKQGATWGDKGKGWQAWHGWGGDEGWAWARRIVKENTMDETKISRRHSESDMTIIRNIGTSTKAYHDEMMSMLSALGDDSNEAKTITYPSCVHSTEVKAVGDFALSGYGVVYGGLDLQNEQFTSDTDFGNTRSFDGMPVYYDHGLGGLASQIGIVKAWKPDDFGIAVDIEIDRRHKYAEQVMELVRRGALGLSTGALSHLVERDGSTIKRWIVGEISLTPTPAEPRTFATTTKAEGEANSPDASGVAIKSEIEVVADMHMTQMENTNMTTAVDKDTLKSLFSTVDKDTLKGIVSELLVGEQVNGGVVVPEAPATKKLTTKGFSNEPTEALMHWVRTGDDVAARQTLKAAMNEGTNSQGGYAVPEDYGTQIVDKRDQTWIGAKLNVQRYTTNRDIFNLADADQKSDFAFVAEAGSANFDEPTLAPSAIVVYTASLAMKLSNQLLRDEAMDLQGFLSREIGRAYARHLNDYMVNGTGSSQPYGILARATVSETLASVAGLDQSDIINIAHKLPAWYSDDSGSVGWVMQNTTLGAIRSLSGNYFSFQPTPMGGMDSLYGKPVAITDKIAVLGTGNKPIIFGNFNYYAFVENMGLEIVRNPYLYMANYQTGIFVNVRWGGDVTQSEAFVYGVNP